MFTSVCDFHFHVRYYNVPLYPYSSNVPKCIFMHKLGQKTEYLFLFLHKTLKISLIFVYQFHFYLYFCGSFGIRLQDEEENEPT
jgi:hypothetical protein